MPVADGSVLVTREPSPVSCSWQDLVDPQLRQLSGRLRSRRLRSWPGAGSCSEAELGFRASCARAPSPCGFHLSPPAGAQREQRRRVGHSQGQGKLAQPVGVRWVEQAVPPWAWLWALDAGEWAGRRGQGLRGDCCAAGRWWAPVCTAATGAGPCPF